MNPRIMAVLLEAEAADVGLVLKVSDVALVKAQLYKGMKEMQGISKFAIITPPVGAEDTLWLVKKGEANGSKKD